MISTFPGNKENRGVSRTGFEAKCIHKTHRVFHQSFDEAAKFANFKAMMERGMSKHAAKAQEVKNILHEASHETVHKVTILKVSQKYF
jgi:hypothetical protein